MKRSDVKHLIVAIFNAYALSFLVFLSICAYQKASSFLKCSASMLDSMNPFYLLFMLNVFFTGGILIGVLVIIPLVSVCIYFRKKLWARLLFSFMIALMQVSGAVLANA